MKYLILTLLLTSNLIFAQVGVGTTSPQETLDINGSLRVSNTSKSPATKMMGSDAGGTLNEVAIGSNLQLTGGTLNAAGTNKYFVSTKTMTTTTPGQAFNDINLDLNGFNKDITVIRFVGATYSYDVTGIAGGTDGRHLLLMNVSTQHMSLTDEDSRSIASNRIVTLANAFEKTSNQGVAELVYDATLQRWVIINFRY